MQHNVFLLILTLKALNTFFNTYTESLTMSGSYGGKRPFSGRKAVAKKLKAYPSRQSYLCPVCKTKKRSDKLNDHISRLCHFDIHGHPIKPESDLFKTFTEEAKTHTLFCVQNNYKKNDTPKWITQHTCLEESTSGHDASFFKKWKLDDGTSNLKELEKSDNEPVEAGSDIATVSQEVEKKQSSMDISMVMEETEEKSEEDVAARVISDIPTPSADETTDLFGMLTVGLYNSFQCYNNVVFNFLINSGLFKTSYFLI